MQRSVTVSSIQNLALESLTAREASQTERAKQEAEQQRLATEKLQAEAGRVAEEIFGKVKSALKEAAKNPERLQNGRIRVTASIPIVEEEVGGPGCSDGGFMSHRNATVLDACQAKLRVTKANDVRLDIIHDVRTKHGGNDDWPTQGECRRYFLRAQMEFDERTAKQSEAKRR